MLSKAILTLLVIAALLVDVLAAPTSLRARADSEKVEEGQNTVENTRKQNIALWNRNRELRRLRQLHLPLPPLLPEEMLGRLPAVPGHENEAVALPHHPPAMLGLLPAVPGHENEPLPPPH